MFNKFIKKTLILYYNKKMYYKCYIWSNRLMKINIMKIILQIFYKQIFINIFRKLVLFISKCRDLFGNAINAWTIHNENPLQLFHLQVYESSTIAQSKMYKIAKIRKKRGRGVIRHTKWEGI